MVISLMVETGDSLQFIILAELLPAKRVAVLVEECDPLGRILGKSTATAKAARKPQPGEKSDQPQPITNHRFTMTDSQSKPEILKSCFAERSYPKK